MESLGKACFADAGKLSTGKERSKKLSAYEWQVNFYKTDANAAGAEFERIYEKYDGLYPKDIVNESRPVDAVLHDEFEWNDFEAAEKYRREQAKKMIHCLKILIEPEKPITRGFYTLTTTVGKENKYEPITVIMESEGKKERLFRMALQELKAFRKKYDIIGELTGLMEMIDALIEDNAG